MVDIPDPMTMGIVAAGWTAKRLVGPFLDEIADGWRQRYSDYRLRNVNEIGRKAERKLGDRLDEEGSIPPRVLARVMEEGSWCEAPVMTEYFGGILAASRTSDGVDDRGAAWAALVARMSTHDVHLHYLVHRAFRDTYVGQIHLPLTDPQYRENWRIYLPASEMMELMNLDWNAITQSVVSLVRERLIAERFWIGKPKDIYQKIAVDLPEDGLVVTPTLAGLHLFCWAHGYGNLDLRSFLDPKISFETDLSLQRMTRAAST